MTDHDLQQLLAEIGPGLHRLLYRITLREDAAEDLLQDLFLRLRNSEAFGKSEHPDRYITRAAVHLAIDWRRNRRMHGPLNDHAAHASPDDPERRDELRRILDGVVLLSGLMREAVILRYLHRADYRAIGAALDRTPHQARALCRKGITRLTTNLQNQGVVPCER